MLSDFNRPIQRKFPRSQLSSGSSIRLCSTTAQPTKRKKITMLPMITLRKTHLVFIDEITTVNSTLNPSLYCWRIREVRQAVKQTIRNVLCCPWSQIFP
ncbi:hypothetical protein pdam_00008517 [Pocillopora damicornis]|uniref:Uncharacterized protein n=1 Tax=Pocillopora damicornis TaxID=46731 RepID=A0A3M6U4J0_POCDA|nr:hypothetical protein pdam_00008517 [Pocillopora damicornis]